MTVFRSIVFSAVVSGFLVGAAVTAAQLFSTVPLILKAETYERSSTDAAAKSAPAKSAPATSAPAAHEHADHQHADHQHADHDHGSSAWEPKDGWQRNAFTAAANVLTAIGFALLLSGIYALRGHPVSWHEGVLWGLGGFAVFTIAPGLGLPPEPPGVPAAALDARQMWWIATAAATAAGLGLFVFKRTVWAAVLGFCLIVSPHLIGAPQLAARHTDVPEALSHQFAVAVTLTSFLFWVLLGSLTSVAYRRFSA